MEIIVFYICLGLTMVEGGIALGFDQFNEYSTGHTYQYLLAFPLIAVLSRIFTVLPTNRDLLYVVSTVLTKLLQIIAVLSLFIYVWARIGCTAFGDDQKDIVLEEIYEPSSGMIANFNSLSYAVLTLIQLMIGEGWHEIMYTNALGTSEFCTVYFILYIMAVSIIIANIFVGLLLANVDELQEKQIHDEISHRSIKTKSFEKFAKSKQELLKYRIENHQDQVEVLQEQLVHIQDILERQSMIRQQRNMANLNALR